VTAGCGGGLPAEPHSGVLRHRKLGMVWVGGRGEGVCRLSFRFLSATPTGGWPLEGGGGRNRPGLVDHGVFFRVGFRGWMWVKNR